MESQPLNSREGFFGFSPETFCDEVYDQVDDYLADGMDEMEKELVKVSRQKGANVSLEVTIHSCCDNIQKQVQEEFDKNLDIFDRFFKKRIFKLVPSHILQGSGAGGSSGFSFGKGVQASGEGEGAGEGEGEGREAGGAEGGDTGMELDDERRQGLEWESEFGEGFAPPTEEEIKALDKELLELSQRRWQAMYLRKKHFINRAQLLKLKEVTEEFLEALKAGVGSSFDENCLAPLPLKVQEAVRAGTELRRFTARARELTKIIKGDVLAMKVGSADAAVASKRPRTLQSVYQQSRQQVVTEDPTALGGPRTTSTTGA